MLRDFEEIYATAAARKGGERPLEELIARTASLPPAEIAALSDDRVLSRMSQRVFSARFSSRIIEQKWPAFETAFDGFDPISSASMSEERYDALLQDRSIVRSPARIRSVARNAQWLVELAAEHGSAARFFASWPDERYVDLLLLVQKRGDRMGGATGMRFIRSLGKPAFVSSPDMVAALVREGVLDGPPSSKRSLHVVQDALNQWARSSGRDLTAISRILAMSIGELPAAQRMPWDEVGL
jgi:3-methyladenine DNA glycosylase Tag